MPTQACLQRQREGRCLGFRGLTLRPPWTAARQVFLSITNSRSLLKFMSIASVMLSINLDGEGELWLPKKPT